MDINEITSHIKKTTKEYEKFYKKALQDGKNYISTLPVDEQKKYRELYKDIETKMKKNDVQALKKILQTLQNNP